MTPDSLLIALDWDGTVTADEDLWLGFIQLAQARGHRVFIATAREEERLGTIRAKVAHLNVRVVGTNGRPKIKDVDDQTGWMPSIWIDDMPETLFSKVAE